MHYVDLAKYHDIVSNRNRPVLFEEHIAICLVRIIMFNTADNSDFKPAGLGWEIGDSSRIIPSYIREHFRIHYVTDGMGWLQTEDYTYCLTEGSGFVKFPGEAYTYYPSQENPWEYFWMGIKGQQIEDLVIATGITRKKPIYCIMTSKDKIRELLSQICITQILPRNQKTSFPDLITLFFSQIKPYENSIKTQSQYIEDCLRLIHNNYSKKITVQDLADALFINRSYLYRLFIANLHKSPQKYIIDYRIIKASEMIVTTKKTISQIAIDVGFVDFSDFHRQFKLRKKISPSAYRSLHKKSNQGFSETETFINNELFYY